MRQKLDCFLLVFVFCFLGPHLWHIEVPRLGAVPKAYGGSQARGRIRAAAAIQPLTWEPPHTAGVAIKAKQNKTNKKLVKVSHSKRNHLKKERERKVMIQ